MCGHQEEVLIKHNFTMKQFGKQNVKSNIFVPVIIKSFLLPRK
jgi:hypothetical protein